MPPKDVIDLLLVEADAEVAKRSADMLASLDRPTVACHHVPSLGGALERLKENAVDVILFDPDTPDGGGIEAARDLIDAAPMAPVIAHSRAHDAQTAFRALEIGCEDYLVAGTSDGYALQRAILVALRHHREAQTMRSLRVLSHCNRTLVRARTRDELLSEFCKAIAEVGEYRLAWVAVRSISDSEPVTVAARHGSAVGYLDGIVVTCDESPSGRGPTGTAIRTGKPRVARNVFTDPDFEPWRETARKWGFGSSVALPLIEDGRPFGALNIYAPEPDAFDVEETELLSELAEDLAYGLVSLRIREDHRKAVDAIAESERRYRDLVELSPDAILVENDGRIIFANENAGRLFGADDVRDLAGSALAERVHPDYADRFVDIAEGPMEVAIMRANGAAVDVEVSVARASAKGRSGTQYVLREIGGRMRRRAAQRAGALTRRERQVALLLANAETNKVIARHLNLSEKTVESHRANIMRKMEARSLADLVRKVRMAGMGEFPEEIG